MNLNEHFSSCFPITKTLRFELKPINETLENINKSSILETDIELANDYKKMKKLIDEYHRHFIEKTLNTLQLPQESLNTLSKLLNSENEKNSNNKKINELQKAIKKHITKEFAQQAIIKEDNKLFKQALITTFLPNYFVNNNKALELINKFKGFTTYFEGFNTTRKNIYDGTKDHVSIPYRLINDNFAKHVQNNRIVTRIKEKHPDLWQELEQQATKLIDSSLSIFFTPEEYHHALSQSQIDVYNQLIGGIKNESDNIQGLNETINLYNQRAKTNLPRFYFLYKQILSEKASFKIDQIESDQQLIDMLGEFNRTLNSDWFHKLTQVIDSIPSNLDDIYISAQFFPMLSYHFFKDHSIITNALIAVFDEESAQTKKKKTNKKSEKLPWKYLSIAELCQKLAKANLDDNKITEQLLCDYLQKISNEGYQVWFDARQAQLEQINTTFSEKSHDSTFSIRQQTECIDEIKSYLDSFQLLLHKLKIIAIDNNFIEAACSSFYSLFLPCYEILQSIIPLYNKVRNYLSQKPYSIQKIKLNFANSCLLKGWDANSEENYTSVILRKNNHYFLGILDKKYNKLLKKHNSTKSSVAVEKGYQKMYLKFLTEANKMLPKVFFSIKWLKKHPIKDPSIREKYKNKTHNKKSENFNLQDCHQLIDYYKECITQYEKWEIYNFQFSETASYHNMDDFYWELEQQGYRVSFDNTISEDEIHQYVSDGKLYLFEIWNKDFSENSKGKANLHTLYWLALFCQTNLEQTQYKLNGSAEIFWRKASLQKNAEPTHSKNVPIKNKNKNSRKKLSQFPYDLIKDKRFTEDKFLFHVPITLNYLTTKQTEGNFNTRVNRYLIQKQDFNIIGLDRGERNLLYLSVIDKHGKLIEQRNLNTFLGLHDIKIDYHDKLDQREKARQEARRSWQSIQNIKELKAGYLSQIIHEITQLMLKYNAVIVLEALNSGFKNSRQRIEKQVYQKFEKALIDKLNYLVTKPARFPQSDEELAPLFSPLQLSYLFDSFKKNQSGFVFFVPAWNTSKIDPTTGFVNLLRPKYLNVEQSQQFFNLFTAIRFNPEENYFEFSVDYRKFNATSQDSVHCWTICSCGDGKNNDINGARYVWNPQNKKHERINITQQMKDLLSQENIVYQNGDDIKEAIVNVNSAHFHRQLTRYLSIILTLRYYSEQNDYILSPVKNSRGEFYDSRCFNIDSDLPCDPDANGAYHIALKGLCLFHDLTQDNPKLNTITNKSWLSFAQQRHKKE